MPCRVALSTEWRLLNRAGGGGIRDGGSGAVMAKLFPTQRLICHRMQIADSQNKSATGEQIRAARFFPVQHTQM
jgi:hypothetical protein